MKKFSPKFPSAVAVLSAFALFCTTNLQTTAQNLADGLIAYWPLDEVVGTRTPDVVGGMDLDLTNLTADDLAPGRFGNAFSFSNTRQTLLSRVHSPGEALPANQYDSFTISLWAQVTGQGQTDLRLFSEASTTSSNPLFNIGTDNAGATGQVDLYFRNPGFPTVDHIKTELEPFDGEWSHIVFVQDNRERRIYINGQLDSLEIPEKPEEGSWEVDNTTIGGILRASASHWVSGLIDDVAIWNRALTQAEINELQTSGMASIFSPLAAGLIAHWPLDEVVGTRTPDVVGGMDMNLSNLTADDLAPGKFGNAFSFSNERQTLLSRVHSPGEALPANQYDSFTISLWAQVTGPGQNDLRLFSEASTTSSDPLFNIGTDNPGVTGQVDLFFRQSGWPTVDHIKTELEPFDGEWSHVVFVQDNRQRRIYIDGQLDSLEIPEKPEGSWQVDNTTIGGILRASASHWVTGLIDEVAIWNRALTQEEIVEVMNSGVPAVMTREVPLEIRRFAPDFPAVVAGDTVILRWDGARDATFSISPGIGDVSDMTLAGVGQTEVSVSGTTAFTLTASRGGETVTAQTTVRAVSNVAEGWRLLENFEAYPGGLIRGQGNWKNPEGEARVVNLGANKALGFVGGNDLLGLDLTSLTLMEGESATLFFRFYASLEEMEFPILINMGLTEKPLRFVGDFNANVGPYIQLDGAGQWGELIFIQARDGFNAEYDFSNETSTLGKVYNFWIDIQNNPGLPDTYSVYMQEEGTAGRITIFQNFSSDRNPAGSQDLGLPLPDLNTLFLVTSGGGQGTENILFDDFYLSSNGFNATVPVPASSFERVDVVAPSEITIVSFGFSANTFSLTWASEPGVPYTVQRKATITAPWETIASNVAGAAGATTTHTDTIAAQPEGYYRVVFLP
jgi:hypothetical protein